MLKTTRSKGKENQREINGDNLNNMRPEATKHFRNKKQQYLRGKINELANLLMDLRGVIYLAVTQCGLSTAICLQIPTTFRIGGRTTLSY
jgi:hypothetical protein